MNKNYNSGFLRSRSDKQKLQKAFSDITFVRDDLAAQDTLVAARQIVKNVWLDNVLELTNHYTNRMN